VRRAGRFGELLKPLLELWLGYFLEHFLPVHAIPGSNDDVPSTGFCGQLHAVDPMGVEPAGTAQAYRRTGLGLLASLSRLGSGRGRSGSGCPVGPGLYGERQDIALLLGFPFRLVLEMVVQIYRTLAVDQLGVEPAD